MTRPLVFGLALALGVIPPVRTIAAALQARPAAPATAPAAPATPTRAELRRELEALTERMERDFDRGDLLAVARTYADDAQMIPPSGAPIVGRAAIDRFWTRLEHPRMWRLETLDWGGGRDEAWQLVRSTLVAGDAATVRPETVRCLLVWRRQPDGAWRIHLDIWTQEEEHSWHASHRN